MDVKPSSVLTMGILSVVFASIPYLNFLGIIFGAIGKSKAASFVAAYGPTDGKVKAGSIMSKIGFIVGIILTIVFTIFIIGIIVANS